MNREFPYRKARFAGAWYAGDADDLRQEIDAYLRSYDSDKDEYTAKIGLLPHAGLYYSGRGIARFFNSLPEQTRRICIIAPSHYTYLNPDKLTTADFSYLETPIADIPYAPLCSSFPEHLLECNIRALKEEHAVEMVLPFIARVSELRGTEISVSIGLVSQFTGVETVEEFAENLITALGEEELRNGETVIIASSDFTHYGNRFGHTPFGTDGIEQILTSVEEEDRFYADGLANCMIEEMVERCHEERPTICGFASGLLAAAVAYTLRFKGVVADYYTSNTLTQNLQPDFVSYCTVIWE